MDTTTQQPTDRFATPHTAVLLPALRKDTNLRSGLIQLPKALARSSVYQTWEGEACTDNMMLGNEFPFYEIAFRGQVYRLLTRPGAGVESLNAPYEEKYVLARTCAPGLKVDGWMLELPSAVPNTPRALLTEMAEVAGASFSDLLPEAYSIFHYRLDHIGQYPETMTPPGYTLAEVLLAFPAEEGAVTTLYETPANANVELWTGFLRELDNKNQALPSYVSSKTAVAEFGDDAVEMMRKALKLRGLVVSGAPEGSTSRFADAFPSKKKPQRDVGVHAAHVYP